MTIATLLQIVNRAWLVERNAALAWLELYERAVAGTLDGNLAKLVKMSEGDGADRHLPQALPFAASRVVVAPADSWTAKSFKGFDGAQVAVIPMSGPLMKADFCGEYGTAHMRNLLQQAIQTDSVHSIVMQMDTPGGTVAGTELMAQAVKDIQAAGKRSITAVDEMAASAGYWIGSSAQEVVLTSSTSMVGSIGTMVTMVDNTEQMKARGVVLREYYATASTDKNQPYNEALKGNGRLLVEQMLDPLNNAFMQAVRTARKIGPEDANGVLTGKVFIGQQAINVGLADRIASVEQVIEGALMAGKPRAAGTTIFFSKQTNTTDMTGEMTLDALKAQHPDLYKQAFAAGVTAERDRTGAWLAHGKTDAERVMAGIKSGKEISATDREELLVKAATAGMAANLASTAPGAVVTGEERKQPSEKDAKVQAFEDAIK